MNDNIRYQRKEITGYLIKKFGIDFVNAMGKVCDPNQFDSQGSLRPGYELTEGEYLALMNNIPELSSILYQEDNKMKR